MRGVLIALVLVGVCSVALGEEERTLIVPKDDKPFTVDSSDYVRLTGNGIAGSRIEAKVDGPAKIDAISRVRQAVNGRLLIGALVKEFDLMPTGAGKVTVTITVTPPQPDAKVRVSKYVFTVE